MLVDDNNRVKKGDVLVELDPEPYRVQVAIKQAAVDAAQAELVVARGDGAQPDRRRRAACASSSSTRSRTWTIRSRCSGRARPRGSKARRRWCSRKPEFDRAQKLLATKVMSAEEFDQKREALDVAKAQVTAGDGERLSGARRARPARATRRRNKPHGCAGRISTRPFPPCARRWAN